MMLYSWQVTVNELALQTKSINYDHYMDLGIGFYHQIRLNILPRERGICFKKIITVIGKFLRDNMV